MMRALTVGLPIGMQSPYEIESKTIRFLKNARYILDDSGFITRTIRYTLPPIGKNGETYGSMMSICNWVNILAESTDVRWFCLPLDFLSNEPKKNRLSIALDVIGRFPKLFLNIIVADRRNLCVSSIHDAASLVLNISKKTNNGFDNFRVGVSCGCQANTPFFPFSYHQGADLAFSVALETTDIALSILNEIGTHPKIDLYRNLFIDRLSELLNRVQIIASRISKETGFDFRGVDASLAPFPDGNMSIGKLIENLNGAPVGCHGSMFITGVLTDAIRAALLKSHIKAVGFNGVMFSLLEDNELASANNRRCISLDSLIGLSAMCGCGIDMVPIPGNSFPEELSAVMLDIAAMSLSLKKPLGIRLLPIPGKSINEFTNFNMDFLCDSRIVSLTANSHKIFTDQHSFEMLAPSRITY